MATANPLESNSSITLEWNKVITITKRTVRFSKTVYQTHNISGFSEGEVEIGAIPWVIIVIFVILGLIMAAINSFVGGSGIIGVLLIAVGIGSAFWNFLKPKHYGFLLTLNSGDKKLFVTTDYEGLKRVIERIYELIETEKEATFQMSINNSKVNGNFIQGYTEGDVSYNSDY